MGEVEGGRGKIYGGGREERLRRERKKKEAGRR